MQLTIRNAAEAAPIRLLLMAEMYAQAQPADPRDFLAAPRARLWWGLHRRRVNREDRLGELDRNLRGGAWRAGDGAFENRISARPDEQIGRFGDRWA